MWPYFFPKEKAKKKKNKLSKSNPQIIKTNDDLGFLEEEFNPKWQQNLGFEMKVSAA